MVYGSFFGGIYIKELFNEGENVGLPKESGFGKRFGMDITKVQKVLIFLQ